MGDKAGMIRYKENVVASDWLILVARLCLKHLCTHQLGGSSSSPSFYKQTVSEFPFLTPIFHFLPLNLDITVALSDMIIALLSYSEIVSPGQLR